MHYSTQKLFCITTLLCGTSASAFGQLVGGETEILYLHEGSSTVAGLDCSRAGDVNGDGFPDFIVGSHYADIPGQGRVGAAYVYSGLDGSLLHQFNGLAVGDYMGYSVSDAGDLNSDGFDDVLVGARHASPGGQSQAGSVYAYSGATGSLLFQWDGPAPNSFFGGEISGSGDVNNDGTPDIIVGASWVGTAGTVFVYSGLTGLLLLQLNGQTPGDHLGWSVANAGDVNGDGFADILAGIPYSSPSGLGAAGGATLYSGMDGAILFQFDGLISGGNMGYSVANAGDVDADGINDFIFGAPLANPGVAYVFSGNTGSLLMQFSNSFTPHTFFGGSVSGAGDVDGDGFADLVVGATGADFPGFTNAGAAYIYSGISGQLIGRLEGSGATGSCVSSLGDVNQDGFDEIIVGSRAASPGGISSAGTASVLSIHPYLRSNQYSVSDSTGGTLTLEFDFPDSAGQFEYKTLISASGLASTIYGAIPLYRDSLVVNTFFGNYPLSSYSDLQGILDASGEAVGSITLPQGSLSGQIGRTFWIAAIANAVGQPLAYSSAAVPLEIIH